MLSLTRRPRVTPYHQKLNAGHYAPPKPDAKKPATRQAPAAPKKPKAA
jgi:hypothetical protein